MLHPQFDQSSSSSLFVGTALMSSQPNLTSDPAASPSKGRGNSNQGAVPVTVKQIADAFASCTDKSTPTINGVDIICVKMLGLVMNKIERNTDVSFTIDDGTGRINFSRWITESSDTNEMATIKNGMYVKVNGSLKGFQSKGHVYASLIRPVTNFNDVVLHFIECVYINLETSRQSVVSSMPMRISTQMNTPFQINNSFSAPFTGTGHIGTQTHAGTQFQRNNSYNAPYTGSRGYQAPLSTQANQSSNSYSGMEGSRTNLYCIVLGVFQEPSVLALEHGLHVEEVVRKLGMPRNKVLEAINYLVDVGHIYSTIDECHFKSAHNC